jgi:dienelactone hydrolase
MATALQSSSREVAIQADGRQLDGTLSLPEAASGLAIFAHGSGSSRHSPRNRLVADALVRAGIGTLLFDLLTRDEETAEARGRQLRFDIGLLARRLEEATAWAGRDTETAGLRIGYFGASTGAAAALVAAARLGTEVHAVVSRGGRPDLAGRFLPLVMAPTLLIVGERDPQVLELNRRAYEQLRCTKALQIVPGAGHLFEERGALERVASFAIEWFTRFLSDEPDMALREDEDLA